MTTFDLSNGATVQIDFENKKLVSASFNGVNVVTGESPLFCVHYRTRDNVAQTVVSTECKFDSFDGKVAHFSHDVFCADLIVAKQLNGLTMKLNLHSKQDVIFEWVEVGSFVVDKKLSGEGGRGAIVYPYNEGCLVTNMQYRESMPFRYAMPTYPSKGNYSVFPNMVCSQFLAYIVDGVGLYYAMHDCERTTKHVNFRYFEDGVQLLLQTYCNVDFGQDYTMPFEVNLTFFSGGWHDACDIYRKWFYENLPHGLVKISQNKRLPKWYGQSPIVVIYPVRGKFDTDKMTPNKFYPYQNALPFLKEFAGKTDSKVMALLMHWEGTAPWAPPYCYEPYGSKKEFERFVKLAHKQGALVGLYCSGFGYTLESNLVDYDKRQDFEKDNVAEAVCTDADGKFESVICTAQRKGYDLCPASAKTKKIFADEVAKICSSKIDYLQLLDQNHGGNSYFCYSDKHGHVACPGKWQAEQTLQLLDSLKVGNALLGCESAGAEPFLSKLNFSDNRFQLNYYNGTPIPIYAYLYHEFVNNFMGNQICAMISKEDNNFPYRVAYSFICGDMLTAVTVDGEFLHSWCDWIEPKDKHVDKQTVYTILRNLNAWRQGALKDILHFGKMTKPLVKLSCGTNAFTLDDKVTMLTVDEVLTSAFTLNGRTAQFVVNYNLQDVTVGLDGECKVAFDCNLTQVERCTQVTIPPLSAVALIWENGND